EEGEGGGGRRGRGGDVSVRGAGGRDGRGAAGRRRFASVGRCLVASSFAHRATPGDVACAVPPGCPAGPAPIVVAYLSPTHAHVTASSARARSSMSASAPSRPTEMRINPRGMRRLSRYASLLGRRGEITRLSKPPQLTPMWKRRRALMTRATLSKASRTRSKEKSPE